MSWQEPATYSCSHHVTKCIICLLQGILILSALVFSAWWNAWYSKHLGVFQNENYYVHNFWFGFFWMSNNSIILLCLLNCFTCTAFRFSIFSLPFCVLLQDRDKASLWNVKTYIFNFHTCAKQLQRLSLYMYTCCQLTKEGHTVLNQSILDEWPQIQGLQTNL